MNKLSTPHTIDESRLNQKIISGEITPVLIPSIVTLSDVVKFQFCSEIIRHKKNNNLKQIELASLLKLDKSEISKLCSYNLKEFSGERLMGFVELLIISGANIDLQEAWEKIKIRSKKIQQKLKSKAKMINKKNISL